MLDESTMSRSVFWFTLLTFSEIVVHFLIISLIGRSNSFLLGNFYFSFFIFLTLLAFFTRLLAVKFVPKLRALAANKEKSAEFREFSAFLLKIYFLVGAGVAVLIYPLLILISILAGFKVLPLLLVFFAIATPFALTDWLIFLILKLRQKFRQAVFIQLSYTLCFRAVAIYLVISFFQKSAVSTAIIQSAALFLTALSGLMAVFGEISLLGFLKKIRWRTFRFSRLALANAGFAAFNRILLMVIVGVLLGFTSLGVLIPLWYLPFLLYFIPVNIFNMFLHIAAIEIGKGREIETLAKRIAKLVFIIDLPILALFLFHPSPLVSLACGGKCVQEVFTVQLLGLAFFAQSISWIAGRILVANKEAISYVVSNYVFALLLSLFLIIAISLWGLKWVGMAYFSAVLADLLLKYFLVAWKTQHYLFNWEQIKILVSGVIAGFITYLLTGSPLVFLFLFLTLFFGALFLLGVLNRTSLKLIKNLAKEELSLRKW